MRRVRGHLTYANLMSTLAVFLVVGGGAAYAANTIFSSDIVDGEVKTADIGNNQVRSADVRDDTMTGADVNEGTLGQVPSAQSAATAQTATSASNSDAVDGHSATCPTGSFENRGLCFDDSPRGTANFTIAADNCATAGGWLPSMSQLRGIRDLPGIDLGNGATAHWVDVLYTDDNGTTNANKGMIVQDN